MTEQILSLQDGFFMLRAGFVAGCVFTVLIQLLFNFFLRGVR